MTTTQRASRFLGACGLAAVALAATALTGCASSSPGSGAASAETLTVDGGNYGAITKNFNPFLSTSSATQLAFTTMIYEPLIQYDGADSAVTYPWLATGAAWSNNNKKLTIALRPGVKWSDGRPLTSADVVFTFNLLKKYPAINTNGITFSSVTASGPEKVVINFATPSYAEYYNILGLTYIVPEHLWASVNPVTYTDPDPVGSGPYVFSSYTSEAVTLIKNQHYWQPGKPAIARLQFPVYDSNDSAAVALENGTVQWGGQFIPGVQKVFAAKSKSNVVWQPGGSDNSLVPNLTDYPLNLLPLRQAMSLAMDRPQISKLGEDGQEPPISTRTGLVLPDQKNYLDPAYAQDTFTTNVAEAKSILSAAGFKRSSSGQLLSPHGSPVAFTLIDPSAYTDFMADAQVISNELNAIGVKVTVQGISSDTWQSDLNDGKFQLSVDYSSGGPSPYYMYNSVLNDQLSAPVGKSANGDYERWNDASTQAAFTAYTNASSDTGRQQSLDTIEGVMVKDLPVIPLFYAANWGQYSSVNFVGWPSPSKPYELATPSYPTEEVVVVRLRPRS